MIYVGKHRAAIHKNNTKPGYNVGKHRAAIHKNNTKPGYNVQLAVLIFNPQIEDN